jgi:hypothetical protein
VCERQREREREREIEKEHAALQLGAFDILTIEQREA